MIIIQATWSAHSEVSQRWKLLLLIYAGASSCPTVRVMVTGQDIICKDYQPQLLLLHVSKYPSGVEDLLECSF